MTDYTIAIVVIIIIIILASCVFITRRFSHANKIIARKAPSCKYEEKWTTIQTYNFAKYIVRTVNQFQKLEDEIRYTALLITWHTDRVRAYRAIFKRLEAVHEQELLSTVKHKYDSLVQMQNKIYQLFDKVTFENDYNMVKQDELSLFTIQKDDALCRLLHNPKGIATTSSGRFLFLPCFVVMQSHRTIKVEEYPVFQIKEAYSLERISFSGKPNRDDEIAGHYWMHEKKKGGPDRRYSYNPMSFIVYRGLLKISIGEFIAELKFSNRAKAHNAVVLFSGIIRRMSSAENRRLYSKIMTCDSIVSIPEIKRMIEEDKKISENSIKEEFSSNDGMDDDKVQEINSDVDTISERGRQPKWDKYETALLIEGYFSIANGKSKEDVISDLSKKLRNMAVLNGENITDIYRNENGIAWQLTYIKKAFGEKGDTVKNPPQIFKEIVDLYKTDRNSFNLLLQIAHEKCGDDINQEESTTPKAICGTDKITATQNGEYNQVDFENIGDYAQTEPEILSYFGEIKSNISIWFDVYKSFLKSLYEDYPTELKTLTFDNDYKFIANQPDKLNAPILIGEGVYVESVYDANEIIKDIKSLLDYCGVAYANVLIRYNYLQSSEENIASVSNIEPAEHASRTILSSQDYVELKVENIAGLDKKIYDIIGQRFKSGCLPGAINYRKIKRYYAEEYLETCDLTDDVIRNSLAKTCVFANGKYYAVEAMLPYELKKRLVEFIHNNLESKGYIYYQTILDYFGFELTSTIADKGLLKEYLKRQLTEYYYFEEYIGMTSTTIVDAVKEVEQLLLDAVYPLSTDVIYSRLSYLTEATIQKALIYDKNILISNGHSRFHIDSMGLTEDELLSIAKLIQEVVDNHTYMFGNELLTIIRVKMPALYERLKDFGELGIRNAIESKLHNRFEFNGNIICRLGTNIDNYSVFKMFAESEKYFTLSSVIRLKEQIGVGTVYFGAINEVASRINDEDYVPTETLSFDSHAIDSVIEQFLSGDMCSVKDACNFVVYPATCYPWTTYLLETYVAKFSDKFKLVHGAYAEGSCVGAIVKKSSPINSLDDVIVAVLSERSNIKTTTEALDILVEEGYIARRRYKGIDELLTKAKAKGRN